MLEKTKINEKEARVCPFKKHNLRKRCHGDEWIKKFHVQTFISAFYQVYKVFTYRVKHKKIHHIQKLIYLRRFQNYI